MVSTSGGKEIVWLWAGAVSLGGLVWYAQNRESPGRGLTSSPNWLSDANRLRKALASGTCRAGSRRGQNVTTSKATPGSWQAAGHLLGT